MLTSPSSQLPIPSDVAKARTDALNSVTQAEAEYRRLVEMQIAKELEIVELVKRKIYEQEELDKFTKDLHVTYEKLQKTRLEEASMKEEIDLYRKEMTEANNLLKDRELKCVEAEKDLERRTGILTTNENQYTIKREELRQEIFAHNLRVDILTKAIKSCSTQD